MLNVRLNGNVLFSVIPFSLINQKPIACKTWRIFNTANYKVRYWKQIVPNPAHSHSLSISDPHSYGTESFARI
jgi:hypothetical protein